MSLGVAEIYNLRGCPKLPLPKIVQDNIASLRITPAAYKPPRPLHKFSHGHHHYKKHGPATSENWREKAIVDVTRRVKEYDDPEYHQIVSLLNKVTFSSMVKLAEDTIELILKRDDVFRLRIVALIVDNAIAQHFIADLMATFMYTISQKLPDIKEDLKSHIGMFDKLYDVNNIVLYPNKDDACFDDKIVQWMKHKDRKKAYAKFMIHLYNKNMITIEDIIDPLQSVFRDIGETCKTPKTPHTEENVTNLVDFVFEISKATTSPDIKKALVECIPGILLPPRESMPSLSMRSRFKLEDALKCVQ